MKKNTAHVNSLDKKQLEVLMETEFILKYRNVSAHRESVQNELVIEYSANHIFSWENTPITPDVNRNLARQWR